MLPEPPSCLLCGAPGKSVTYPFGTFWNGKKFDYLRCGGCGASFVSPLPTDDDFRAMYSQSAYHDEFYGAVEEGTPTALPRFASRLPAGGRLLDYGCGNGAFMLAASRLGLACDGTELDPATRERASANSGRPVLSPEALQGRIQTYDVIHLGDVLEHLPAPAEALRALRPLLREDGLFFIEGPLEDNASLVYYASRAFGALKRLARRPLRGRYPPYHLFRASARAQRRFFEQRLGWRVAAWELFETGWPYYAPGPGLLRSPARLARTGIGGAALVAARAAGPLGLAVGNRFAALIRPE
jgi:SAM-dependent methyltransferase